MESLGFEQCLADLCAFRLVENGHVSIISVVHVDDIFEPGKKSRCDQMCDELSIIVPINNLGDYSRDKERG